MDIQEAEYDVTAASPRIFHATADYKKNGKGGVQAVAHIAGNPARRTAFLPPLYNILIVIKRIS